jgi:hypothetical protein
LVLFLFGSILLLLLLLLLLSCATLLILGWLARNCTVALRNDAGHDDAYLLAVTDIPDLNQPLSAGVGGSVVAFALRKVCDRLMYRLIDESTRD